MRLKPFNGIAPDESGGDRDDWVRDMPVRAMSGVRWSQILEQRYSDDQPRDEKGRWTAGGGGEPKSFAGHDYTPNEPMYSHLVSDGNGGYKLDAERAALHQQILQHFVSSVPRSDHPVAYIMGGGPAAGKSTAMNDAKVGVPKDGAVMVNPDDIKEMLPEYQAQVAAGNVEAANNAHEESSYLGKQLVGLAIANGQSYVLDGTGDKSVESAMAKIALPRANGYEVHGLYVTCPTQDALDRNQARGEATGRFVVPSEIVNIHANISSIVPSVASSFDSFALVDTTHTSPGDPAHVIATASRDQPIHVIDGPAYQTFLGKAK